MWQDAFVTLSKMLVSAVYFRYIVCKGIDMFLRMQWFALMYVLESGSAGRVKLFKKGKMKGLLIEGFLYLSMAGSVSVNSNSAINEHLPEFMDFSQYFKGLTGNLTDILVLVGLGISIYWGYWRGRESKSNAVKNDKENTYKQLEDILSKKLQEFFDNNKKDKG